MNRKLLGVIKGQFKEHHVFLFGSPPILTHTRVSARRGSIPHPPALRLQFHPLQLTLVPVWTVAGPQRVLQHLGVGNPEAKTLPVRLRGGGLSLEPKISHEEAMEKHLIGSFGVHIANKGKRKRLVSINFLMARGTSKARRQGTLAREQGNAAY